MANKPGTAATLLTAAALLVPGGRSQTAPTSPNGLHIGQGAPAEVGTSTCGPTPAQLEAEGVKPSGVIGAAKTASHAATTVSNDRAAVSDVHQASAEAHLGGMGMMGAAGNLQAAKGLIFGHKDKKKTATVSVNPDACTTTAFIFNTYDGKDPSGLTGSITLASSPQYALDVTRKGPKDTLWTAQDGSTFNIRETGAKKEDGTPIYDVAYLRGAGAGIPPTGVKEPAPAPVAPSGTGPKPQEGNPPAKTKAQVIDEGDGKFKLVKGDGSSVEVTRPNPDAKNSYMDTDGNRYIVPPDGPMTVLPAQGQSKSPSR